MDWLKRRLFVNRSCALSLAGVALFVFCVLFLAVQPASAAPVQGLLAQSFGVSSLAAAAPDPNWVPAAREYYATSENAAPTALGDGMTGGIYYAFANASQFDTIYLGADILRTTSEGDNFIHMSENQTLVFDGLDPRTGVEHIYNAQGTNDGIGFVAPATASSPRTFEMRNMTITTTSDYCAINAFPGETNVTLVYNNIDYTGPQAVYNYGGKNIFKGTNIFRTTGYAFAEAHYLEFASGSDTTINDNTPVYNSFYIGYPYTGPDQARGLFVDDDAKLDWSTTGPYGILGNYAWAVPVAAIDFPISIGNRADVHFTVGNTLNGTLPDTTLSSIAIGDDANVQIDQTEGPAPAGGMIKRLGAFTVGKNVRLWFNMPYGGTLFSYPPSVGIVPGFNDSFDVSQARSFGYSVGSGVPFTFAFNNYRVNNGTVNMPTIMKMNGEQLFYYTSAASPDMSYPNYTTPDVLWGSADGQGEATALMYHSTSENTVMINAGDLWAVAIPAGASFKFTDDGVPVAGYDRTTFARPYVLSVGDAATAALGPAELTDETTSVTGTAEPDSHVVLHYIDADGAEQNLPPVTADASGAWSVEIPSDHPLGVGTSVSLGVELDYRWNKFDNVATVKSNAVPPTTTISYDDASCGICHYANAAREHQARGGCADCHSSEADYTQTVSSTDYPYNTATKKTCGTANDACHGTGAPASQQWHGDKPAETSQAHEMSAITTPTAGDASVSCGGYSAAGSTCHGGTDSAWSSESRFYFGTMDVASAHADYAHAAQEGLTTITPSSQITASTSACGICHDKTSTSPDMVISSTYNMIKQAQEAGTFSCRTCHNSTDTYVASDAYPAALQASYATSVCFKTSQASGILRASLTSAAPVQMKKTAAPQTTQQQLNSLVTQLSPDLQAQLSGVAPTGAEDLKAGTVSSDTTGIPTSALPATSLKDATLFPTEP